MMNIATSQSLGLLISLLGSGFLLNSLNSQIVWGLVMTIRIGMFLVLVSMLLSVTIRAFKLKASYWKRILSLTGYFALATFLWLANTIVSRDHVTKRSISAQTSTVPVVVDVSPAPETSMPTRTHVVIAGESLWSIARKYYGKGSLWKDLKHDSKNTIIHPGEVLEI